MQLQVQPSEFGLEESKAQELIKGLSVTLKEREILKDAFLDVTELEVSEENIPTFKELRLKIVKNRTQGIEKWHKTQKAFYLAGGRFVDAIKNKEIAVNQEMEERLLDAEKHFENLEKERINKLQFERAEKLSKYVDDISHIDLGNMDDDIWNAYFTAKKQAHEERIAEEKRLEAERLENERLDKLESDRNSELATYSQFFAHSYNLREMAENEYSELKKQLVKAKKDYDTEHERVRLENERLKKEREAAEKKRLAEEKKRKADEDKKQAEYEANLKKEREAREKLEREEKARKDAEKAEADRKAKEEDEKRKEAERLAKAPVKEKLSLWVDSFELPTIDVQSEAKDEIEAKFQAFKKWSINQIKNL